MIELPESMSIAGQIRERLQGKTVAGVEVNRSPHKFAWFHGEPSAYEAKLMNKKVTGANAFGGIIEIEFGDTRLALFEDPNPRYFEKGAKLPDKHQLCVGFGDGSALVCTVKLYGAMWLMGPDDAEEGYYVSSKTGVSPLSDENDEDYFFGLMGKVKQTYSMKAFLATEQRYPGLGNGVLQDILFNAGIHPRRKLASLSEQEKAVLYQSVKRTLSEMVEHGGRDTENDLFGNPGGYKTKLSAKTKDMPCPVCGGAIVKEAYMGGSVYFCPTCQKK